MQQRKQESAACDKVTDKLSAYIDGELTPFDQVAIRRHLRTCRSCQEQAAGLTFVRERIRRVRASIPSEIFILFMDFLLWTQPEQGREGEV